MKLQTPLGKFVRAIIFVTSLFFLSGCVSNPSGRLLASTVQSVDAAMIGWSTYVVTTHKPTVDQETAVRLAYERYQAAESVAETAYVASVKTGDQSRAADALQASQRALLTLIASLQPK